MTSVIQPTTFGLSVSYFAIWASKTFLLKFITIFCQIIEAIIVAQVWWLDGKAEDSGLKGPGFNAARKFEKYFVLFLGGCFGTYDILLQIDMILSSQRNWEEGTVFP